MSFVISSEGIFWLNGKNGVIYHAMNDKLGLNLTTEAQAKEYTKFFYSYVSGPHGSFSIVESYDELERNNIISNGVEGLLKRIPKKVLAKFINNHWEVEIIINFQDALFYSRNIIDGEGEMNLLDDTLLAKGFGIDSYVYEGVICKRKEYEVDSEVTMSFDFSSLKRINEIDYLRDYRLIFKDFEDRLPFWYTYNRGKIRKLSNKKVLDILEKTLLDEPDDKWSFSCFSDDSWMVLEKSLSKEIIIEALKDESFPIITEVGEFDAVRSCGLSFYPEAKLYECRFKVDNKNKFLFFVKHKKGITFLDGKSRQIHQMNKELSIELNDKTIKDYLKFFNYEVHGDHGRFLIVESYDDLEKRGIKAKNKKNLLATIPRKVSVNRIKSNLWEIKAIVNYGDLIFQVLYYVNNSGRIEMISDIFLASGFGIILEIFVDYFKTTKEVPMDKIELDQKNIDNLDF